MLPYQDTTHLVSIIRIRRAGSLRVIDGESDTFKRQGLVLQIIMTLKQICNHSAQYLKKGDTGDLF